MKEQEILKIIEKFYKKLPKFPDGRIDYSNSDIAPVITVFVKYKDKIILLKRSDKVGNYCGKWSTVTGFLDELKPLHEKVFEELEEELGVEKSIISSILMGKSFKLIDKNINKTWIIHPILVELQEMPKIKLDYEHIEFKWIKPEELNNFDTVPKLEKSLKSI